MKSIAEIAGETALTYPNGIKPTAEYYILRIYRRKPGKAGEQASLVGVVEDTEGRHRSFQDKEELWKALAENPLGQQRDRPPDS